MPYWQAWKVKRSISVGLSQTMESLVRDVTYSDPRTGGGGGSPGHCVTLVWIFGSNLTCLECCVGMATEPGMPGLRALSSGMCLGRAVRRIVSCLDTDGPSDT